MRTGGEGGTRRPMVRSPDRRPGQGCGERGGICLLLGPRGEEPGEGLWVRVKGLQLVSCWCPGAHLPARVPHRGQPAALPSAQACSQEPAGVGLFPASGQRDLVGVSRRQADRGAWSPFSWAEDPPHTGSRRGSPTSRGGGVGGWSGQGPGLAVMSRQRPGRQFPFENRVGSIHSLLVQNRGHQAAGAPPPSNPSPGGRRGGSRPPS